jgi:hypothetical protein
MAALVYVTNFLSLYSLLYVAGVSSVPIVDENDALLDTYSRRYIILTCNLQMPAVFGCVSYIFPMYLSIHFTLQ